MSVISLLGVNNSAAITLIRWTVVRLNFGTTQTDVLCGWDTAQCCGWASDLAAPGNPSVHNLLQTRSGQKCRLLGRASLDAEGSQALGRRLALLSTAPDISDVSREYESIALPCILA
mgnify:CR=1 FL=1